MKNFLPYVEHGNGTFEVSINPSDLTISKEKIGSVLGYTDKEIPEHFGNIIEHALEKLPTFCEIKAGYRVLDVQKTTERHDGLLISGTFFKTHTIVASQLKDAEEAALFACTIGPGMEAWSGRLFREGDAVMGHIADAIASTAVENATDALHGSISATMLEHGLKTTNRYSPGYCGWPVAEQRLLFSLLPEGFCGITLTESALMVPIKSVSGIIGIGAAVNREDYLCDRCGRKDCTYRALKRRVDKK